MPTPIQNPSVDIEALKVYIQAGHNVHEAAAFFDVSPNYIHALCAQFGIYGPKLRQRVFKRPRPIPKGWEKHKKPPEPPPPHVPIPVPPAMARLAQYDPIVARCVNERLYGKITPEED